MGSHVFFNGIKPTMVSTVEIKIHHVFFLMGLNQPWVFEGDFIYFINIKKKQPNPANHGVFIGFYQAIRYERVVRQQLSC